VVAPLSVQKDKPPATAGYVQIPAPKSVESRPLATRDILKLDGPSVLEIEVHDGAGAVVAQASGVVIAPGGIVATNAHVVTGACNLYIKETSGSLIAASTLLNIDRDKDIAILLFPKSFPVPKLGASSALQSGDRVVAIGNPLGLEQTVSEGIVSGLRTMGDKRAVIQTTAPISPGSSGGGLFNGKGELVGLTTFTLPDSQNLNFAVPLADVMSLHISAAEEVTPEDMFLWAVTRFPNCSPPTPSLEVLGHNINELQVQEILKALNGGIAATPTKLHTISEGEFRHYEFYTAGIEFIFMNGLCESIGFHPSFRGTLPLGLSWDKTRNDVLQLLVVRPSWSDRNPTNNDFIDRYGAFGEYSYDIFYTAAEKLNFIGVSRYSNPQHAFGPRGQQK